MAGQLDKIYEQSATTAEAKQKTKIELPPTTQFPVLLDPFRWNPPEDAPGAKAFPFQAVP
jgi:hypothetical protein